MTEINIKPPIVRTRNTLYQLINTPRVIVLLYGLFISCASFAQSDESETVASTKQAFSFETKPVWEAGFGVGYFSGTDYPGSKDPNLGRFIAPFFIYRSRVVRVGDGGFGAVAVEEPRLKIDVSLGGSLNATPKVDSVRAGMPDLDLLFEFGPSLKYKVFQSLQANGSTSVISADANLRAVISTDFKGVRAQGFVFSTGMEYKQRDIIVDKLDVFLGADITFADKRYNDYIYSVPVEFSTPTREAYNGKAGYVETAVTLGLAIKPHPDWRVFVGLSAASTGLSANKESPLFETDLSGRFGIGIIWTALRSKNTIEVYSDN